MRSRRERPTLTKRKKQQSRSADVPPATSEKLGRCDMWEETPSTTKTNGHAERPVSLATAVHRYVSAMDARADAQSRYEEASGELRSMLGVDRRFVIRVGHSEYLVTT